MTGSVLKVVSEVKLSPAGSRQKNHLLVGDDCKEEEEDEKKSKSSQTSTSVLFERSSNTYQFSLRHSVPLRLRTGETFVVKECENRPRK